MVFLLPGVLLCIGSVFTVEFGLNFRDDAGTLKHTFDSPIDFTDGFLEFEFDIDREHYDAITASASVSQVNIIQLNSIPDESGKFDTLLVDLYLTQVGQLPMLMITFSTPLSSGNDAATGYCVILPPHDYLNQPLKLGKTGKFFTMLGMPVATSYCETGDIGAPDTGSMTFSTLSIGPRFKGCLSHLSIPSYSAIPEGECDPLSGLSGDVVYFEGTCAMGSLPEDNYKCPAPTTPAPTTPAPTTSELPITTEFRTTTASWSTSSTEVPTLPPPETTPPANDTVVVDGDGNGTDGGYDINNTEDDDDDASNETIDTASEEASHGDSKDSSSIVIVIAIVSAGVVVVVIVLFVGYRWHYRDKGSYKLEDGKAAEANGDGDEFGNEYTDLTGNRIKDQEWYL